MQYSPKLKKTIEKIKKILEEDDVAGIVVLHTPGFSEYLTKINPSYSCAKMENGGIRIRAKAEDFGGDTKQRDLKLQDTVNMINHLATNTAMMATNLIEIDEALTKHTNAIHTSGDRTSHEQQNN